MDPHSSSEESAPCRTNSRRTERSFILTINGGSSSLKFALFTALDRAERLVSGAIERIGMPGTRFIVKTTNGSSEESTVAAPDQAAAVALLIKRLEQFVSLEAIAIIGHRVVHGGSRFYRPELVTPEVLDELRRIVPYDPDHLPGEIDAIEAFHRLDSQRLQVACFDTAFHHELPRVAQIIAIPRR